MAQLIDLKLVNEAGTPVAWPGTSNLVQVNLVENVDPVWIGVSVDGLSNQSYPVSTPIATILGIWAHVYQGIELVINGQTNVYNNGLLDYERRVAACCIAPKSEESPSPVESPGESPSPEEPPFDLMMRVNFGDPGQEFAFELNLFTPAQFYVDWGDGSPEEPFFGDNNIPSHVYADSGEYTVRLRFEPPAPTVVDSIIVSNMPITYFAFSPDWTGAGLALNILQLDSGQLTDAGIDFPAWEFVSINTVILANNQFTNAVLALLPTGFTTLNLSGNNLGTFDLGNISSGLNTLGNLFLNNCNLTAADLSDGINDMASLQMQNNQLNGFDVGEISVFAMTELRLNGNSIPSVDVDAILQALDAQGNENGLVDLSGQTPAAPPGGAGIVAQGSLESKFWTVTVDS